MFSRRKRKYEQASYSNHSSSSSSSSSSTVSSSRLSKTSNIQENRTSKKTETDDIKLREEPDVRNVTKLLETSARGMYELNVNSVCERFRPILSEFVAFVENFRAENDSRYTSNYCVALSSFVDDFLRVVYSGDRLKKKFMYVNYKRYVVSEWGGLYWSFLHYSSILLQYALSCNMIDDVRNFASIVFNIDAILPCNLCRAHYMDIKRSSTVAETVQLIVFGHPVLGVYRFHSLITKNIIDKSTVPGTHADNLLRSKRFTPTDFTRTYNVYPNTLRSQRRLDDYDRAPLDWQTNTHANLSVLLAIALNVSLTPASDRLKRCNIYKNVAASNYIPKSYSSFYPPLMRNSTRGIVETINNNIGQSSYRSDGMATTTTTVDTTTSVTTSASKEFDVFDVQRRTLNETDDEEIMRILDESLQSAERPNFMSRNVKERLSASDVSTLNELWSESVGALRTVYVNYPRKF